MNFIWLFLLEFNLIYYKVLSLKVNILLKHFYISVNFNPIQFLMITNVYIVYIMITSFS